MSESVVPASVKATERGIETIGISLAKEGQGEENICITIVKQYFDVN